MHLNALISYMLILISVLDPQIGKRKPNRWFVPIEKGNFEQELPAEWEGIQSKQNWTSNNKIN